MHPCSESSFSIQNPCFISVQSNIKRCKECGHWSEGDKLCRLSQWRSCMVHNHRCHAYLCMWIRWMIVAQQGSPLPQSKLIVSAWSVWTQPVISQSVVDGDLWYKPSNPVKLYWFGPMHYLQHSCKPRNGYHLQFLRIFQHAWEDWLLQSFVHAILWVLGNWSTTEQVETTYQAIFQVFLAQLSSQRHWRWMPAAHSALSLRVQFKILENLSTIRFSTLSANAYPEKMDCGLVSW